ncbi:hypothetical protein GCM10011409_36970 [Lentibacillus populi]|uniref:Uncharacterized protein n=1 Tax=Lentibacillus populi TaxID=1827502 RepID=A0A9W5U0Y3_9BACI|nr:hypothetical protein GCM10011409_36970 [Lentibacillus populi]
MNSSYVELLNNNNFNGIKQENFTPFTKKSYFRFKDYWDWEKRCKRIGIGREKVTAGD